MKGESQKLGICFCSVINKNKLEFGEKFEENNYFRH